MLGRSSFLIWGVPVDMLLFAGAFLLAARWRLGWPPPAANTEAIAVILPNMVLMLPFVFYGFGLYHRRDRGSMMRSILFAQGLMFVLVLAAAFWFRGFAFPRSVVLIGSAISLAGMVAWRLLLDVLATRTQRVVVVAPRGEAAQVIEKVLMDPSSWYEVIRVLDPDELGRDFNASLLEDVDLIVAGPSVSGHSRSQLLRLAAVSGVSVFLIPEVRDILVMGSSPNQIGDTQVFEIRPLCLTRPQRVIKRCFDLVLSVLLVALLSPVMICVWAAIKIFTPGPALYTQKRVGLNGKEFVLLKFRTMVVDAESSTGPVLATKDDPRVTRIGRILRASRLDELPQLFNVIKGDMSLVGPRPERQWFVERYAREMPDYVLRHLVPPGITGLAQIKGRYCTTAADKLRFDLYYVRHYSLWLDLSILLMTLQAVISRDSAVGVSAQASDVSTRAQELALSRSSRA